MIALISQISLMAVADVRKKLDRARRHIILMALAGILFFIAALAAIATVWIMLAAIVGPLWSGVIIAAVCVAIGLFFLAIDAYLDHRNAQRERLLREARAASAPMSLGLAGQVPGMIKANPLVAVAAIGLLSYLFARSQGIGKTD
ncbi:hypothetical protein NAC44_20795 [Allorhizobium sp. BGMRC 0089]|uniref:hypothetical protein n=1 Tax=Allorhizobium sonneratiae TaxID=2934936 RepID=UPI002033EC8F|nr:hypothetical protein [Allorhizobium sonneratiae]MCM2294768.1 hypothetical protein [Allorhizobium sonneratiae]